MFTSQEPISYFQLPNVSQLCQSLLIYELRELPHILHKHLRPLNTREMPALVVIFEENYIVTYAGFSPKARDVKYV